MKELNSEITMVQELKFYCLPLQSYKGLKTKFSMFVNVDVNFDKLVQENMFCLLSAGFPKTGHK